MPRDYEERIDKDGEAEFVMAFIEMADRPRQEFLPIWQETLSNYLVVPFGEMRALSKSNPLLSPFDIRRADPDYSVLKDATSHNAVESLVAAMVLGMFSEPGYIVGKRVGIEDTYKASTATRLIEYVLSKEGVFRTLCQWIRRGFIFGTSIVETYWEYDEQYGLIREPQFAPDGSSYIQDSNGLFVSEDDPCIENVDIMDFFPDPGADRMSKMKGCVRRKMLTAREARTAADRGMLDPTAVEEAISTSPAAAESREMSDNSWREGLDKTQNRYRLDAFKPMVMYTYYGEAPWKPKKGEDTWRVIPIINGVNAGSRSWPFRRHRLPYYEMTPRPLDGRFYGIAPIETARYDQDLADVLKMMIADAAIRMVHPPFAVDRNAQVDYAALKAFRTRTPVRMRGVDGVKQIPYSPPIERVGALLGVTQGEIKAEMGAMGIFQGEGLGVNRASGTEAASTAQQASMRPNFLQMLIEREYLPPLGIGILELFQLVMTDDQEIAARVGEQPHPYPLADIMLQHDIRCQGLKLSGNKEARHRALIEMGQAIAATPVMPLFPWAEWMALLLRSQGADELEAMIADPQASATYAILAQMIGTGSGKASGNGAMPAPSPSGMLPAQTAGATG